MNITRPGGGAASYTGLAFSHLTLTTALLETNHRQIDRTFLYQPIFKDKNRPAHEYLPLLIDHRFIFYSWPASMGTLSRQTRFACDSKRIKRRSRADVNFGKRRVVINCSFKKKKNINYDIIIRRSLKWLVVEIRFWMWYNVIRIVIRETKTKYSPDSRQEHTANRWMRPRELDPLGCRIFWQCLGGGEIIPRWRYAQYVRLPCEVGKI